jgi:hypothetical protein
MLLKRGEVDELSTFGTQLQARIADDSTNRVNFHRHAVFFLS